LHLAGGGLGQVSEDDALVYGKYFQFLIVYFMAQSSG
jgi:hypothetical protein